MVYDLLGLFIRCIYISLISQSIYQSGFTFLSMRFCNILATSYRPFYNSSISLSIYFFRYYRYFFFLDFCYLFSFFDLCILLLSSFCNWFSFVLAKGKSLRRKSFYKDTIKGLYEYAVSLHSSRKYRDYIRKFPNIFQIC